MTSGLRYTDIWAFFFGVLMPASQSEIVARIERCLAREALHHVVEAPDPQASSSSSSANSEVNSLSRVLSSPRRYEPVPAVADGRRTSNPLRRSRRRSTSAVRLGAAAVAAYANRPGVIVRLG